MAVDDKDFIMIIADAMEKFSMRIKDLFSLTYSQLSLLLEGAYMKQNIANGDYEGYDDMEEFTTQSREEKGYLDADTINAFFGG